MKKRCIAVLLLWVIITCFGLYIRTVAYADPVSLTFSQLAGAAYALGSSMGINWGFVGSPDLAEDLMIGQLQSYAGTDSIEYWAVDELRVAAGKLLIPAQIYGLLRDFIQNLADNNLPISQSGDTNSGDIIVNGATGSGWHWDDPAGYASVWFYYGTQKIGSRAYANARMHPGSVRMWFPNPTTAQYSIFMINNTTGESAGTLNGYLSITISSANALGSFANYSSYDSSLYPTELPLESCWAGDWGEAPDTNLDQIIGSVFDDLADLGDIDVTGDIVDPPPVPTPAPTYPPASDILGGINTEIEQGNDVIQGLNDLQNLMEGVNEGLNDIDLGVGEAAGTISDAVVEAAEGVSESIGTQTGVISGAIDQATSDVVDAIGEQTAALDQTLTETAEGVQDIAEALQPGQITPRQFDLRRLFPFCIPFDIHNLLQKFDAEPVAPHVQLPFVIQSIGFSYTFDLDFSAFNSVAAVMRTVEFIVFAIGLAWATSKVIKW